MSKKLYVGNLLFSFTDDDLSALFAEFSPSKTVISARVIKDRETGRSKGFGFVEMEDAEAERAIQELHGRQIEGRAISVNEARPQGERSSGGGRGGRGGYDNRSRGGYNS